MAVSVVPASDLPDSAASTSSIVPSSDLPSGASPSMLDSAASSISKVLDPISQMPELQPYANPMDAITSLIPKNTGSPVRDAVNAARALLDMPSRLSQTLGQGSGVVSGDVAEDLGKKGIPAPLSAAIAMGVGSLSDPRSIAALGEGGIESPDALEVGGGNAATKARAAQFENYGIDPTIAQATQNQLAQRAETFLNRYPYSAQNFQDFYSKQLAEADNIRSALMQKVGDSKATQTVANMMKDKISNYLQNASPEDASVLQDKFVDLDSYMKNQSVGEFSQSMLAQSRKIALENAGKQFDAIRNIVSPDAKTDIPLFSAKAKELLDNELNSDPNDRNPAWAKRLASYSGTQQIPGMDLADSVTGNEASKLQDLIRQQLGQTSDQTTYGAAEMAMKKLRDLRISNDHGYLMGIPGQGNTYAGYAAQLRGALHEDIGNSLAKIADTAKKAIANNPPEDPNALLKLSQEANVDKAYSEAKANYAKTKQIVNDPFITNLLKNDPEDFLKHAVQSQDVTNISKLKNLLGEDNFQPVKENLLANMLVDKDGNLSPSSFVAKVNKLGFPSLTKVFNPDELAEITNAQNVFKNMGATEKSAGNTSGTAGVMMTRGALLGAPSSALTALFLGHPGAATGTMATALLPKLIAKAYLSQPIRDLIIHGVSAPDSAMTALGLMGKGAMLAGMQNSAGQQQGNANGDQGSEGPNTSP